MKPRSLAICSAPLLLSASLVSQAWLDWTDETATRLSLTSVIPADDQEKDMIQGDFDQDGDEDVLVVRKLPFSNPGARGNLLLMNEGGVLTERTATLAPELLTASDARDVMIFDADNDGWTDFVVANTFGEQPQLFMNQGSVGGVWQGFVEAANWAPTISPGPQFCAVYEGDVDNDGDDDLYFSDYDTPLEDQLLINDGTGNFTNETAARFPTGANNSVFGTGSFVCDFTGDGIDDILKISGMFDPMDLLINDGTGVFTQVQQLSRSTFPQDAVYMARVADFDLNGRLDIYVIDDSDDFILYNMSTNPDNTINTVRFTLNGSPRTAGFGGNVKAADLDRDGYPDIGVCDVDVDIANCNDNRFAAIRNNFGRFGTRTMVEPDAGVTRPWNARGTHDIVFIDINGDGFLDIFMGLCTGYKVFIMDPLFAVAETYGDGCNGSNGLPPAIGALDVPQIGSSTFGFSLDDAAPNAPVTLLLAVGSANIPFFGCNILLDPVTLFDINPGVGTDMSGSLSLLTPLPSDPAQEGISLNAQWFVVDFGATFLNAAALSNGLELYLSTSSL